MATAARLGADPGAVQAALDEFDAILLRRAQERRADARALLAELAARDGEPLDAVQLEAEAERACEQEDQERLAAELRRLVIPDATAIRQARARGVATLERCCQAAVDVLATLPRPLEEFAPGAERRHAAERAVRDGLAKREAQVTRLLEEAGWWRRRGLRRELAGLHRDRQAAEQRLPTAAARLAAVWARHAQRAAWLAWPDVAEALAKGGGGAWRAGRPRRRRRRGDRRADPGRPATPRPWHGRPPQQARSAVVSAANAALGGCAWRRCPHQATAVVAFQVPHPLAGTRRGYCGHHAGQVAGQPGAVLTGAGGVPVQPELPGLDAPAEPGWPPRRGGGQR